MKTKEKIENMSNEDKLTVCSQFMDFTLPGIPFAIVVYLPDKSDPKFSEVRVSSNMKPSAMFECFKQLVEKNGTPDLESKIITNPNYLGSENPN